MVITCSTFHKHEIPETKIETFHLIGGGKVKLGLAFVFLLIWVLSFRRKNAASSMQFGYGKP